MASSRAGDSRPRRMAVTARAPARECATHRIRPIGPLHTYTRGTPGRRAANEPPCLMNPDAANLWRRPRSALAALLACLGMLGAFSIDTYIPAFAGIARALDATPVQMQQTLSAYLFGFAVMNLFYGALADSFGRRPVVLWGIA